MWNQRHIIDILEAECGFVCIESYVYEVKRILVGDEKACS